MPNYISKSNEIDVNGLNKLYGRDKVSSFTNPPTSIMKPQSVEDIIQQKYEAQEAMAYANFQKRMMNAGAIYDTETGQPNLLQADAALLSYANASFQNDIADLQTWHRTLKGKLAMIAKESSFTSQEKDLLRNKVLSNTKDAIYIPDMTSSQINKQEKPIFSQAHILRSLGDLGTNRKYRREGDLTTAAAKAFGPDFMGIPGVSSIISARKAKNGQALTSQELAGAFGMESSESPQPDEETATESKRPTKEQLRKYKELGGSKTKEGREFRQKTIKELEGSTEEIPTITSEEEYKNLTKGTEYIYNGKRYIKGQ